MHTHQGQFSGNSPLKPFYLPKRTLQEQSRLTFQHHTLRTALSGNFLAPCAHPTSILDVVCGTGAWTADMAKLFPQAQIVGIDSIRPTCPQPSHVQFIEGRSPSALPFNDAHFDYVHQRCLSTVIPTVHWQTIINELVRVTRFGGWIELMEYGPFASVGPKTVQFGLWWQEALAKRGIDLLEIEHLGDMLQSAGLEHVQHKTISLPLFGGGRATDGMRTNLLAMIQMAKTSILALGIPASTWVSVTSSLPEEWLKHQTAYQFYVAYGQRPSLLFHAVDGQRPNTKTSLIQQRLKRLGTRESLQSKGFLPQDSTL